MLVKMVLFNFYLLMVLYIKGNKKIIKGMVGVDKLFMMLHIMKDIGKMMLHVEKGLLCRLMEAGSRDTGKMIIVMVKASIFLEINWKHMKVITLMEYHTDKAHIKKSVNFNTLAHSKTK